MKSSLSWNTSLANFAEPFFLSEAQFFAEQFCALHPSNLRPVLELVAPLSQIQVTEGNVVPSDDNAVVPKILPMTTEAQTFSKHTLLASDSGYSTMSPGYSTMFPEISAEVIGRDEDAISIASMRTDGTEIRLPGTDQAADLISAFARDLRRDLDFSESYYGAVEDKILANLPTLLKKFTLKLERNSQSELENKAKRFVRQKRK